MKARSLTILTVLCMFAFAGVTYAQQQRGNGGYGGYNSSQGQRSPNVFDNQDGTQTGVINRTDPNGGYGGYWPGKGPGSPCVGCGPTTGGYQPPVSPCTGNGCGGGYRMPTPINPNFNNTVNVNNTYNNRFYRPFLQEVELQATGTGFGILRDYFAVKFQTSGQLKVQREKSETDKQLAMVQMQMMMQMNQQSQQRDTYRESNTRTERYERDDRRVESEAPPERWTDVHIANSCDFTVQLAVNGEVVKTLGSRHAVSIPVPIGGRLTVLRMDGSTLRTYGSGTSEIVIQ